MAVKNFVEISRAGLTLTGNEIEALTALLKICTGEALKGVAELGRIKATLAEMGASGANFNAEIRDGKVYVVRA